MRQTRRHVAALTAGLLLLTACSGEDSEPQPDPPPIGGDENDADEDDQDNEPVEEEDDEPYAVPDEIDEAYAEDVINVLLEINSEALATVLRQEPGETIAPEAADQIAAVSDGRRLAQQLEYFQRYIDQPDAAAGFLPPDDIGTSRIDVQAILHAEPDNCMVVVGWWDLTEVAVDPPDVYQVFSLGRLDRDVTAEDRNPTPWKIRQVTPMQDSEGEPVPEEEWDDVNFADAFDHTCEGR